MTSEAEALIEECRELLRGAWRDLGDARRELSKKKKTRPKGDDSE